VVRNGKRAVSKAPDGRERLSSSAWRGLNHLHDGHLLRGIDERLLEGDIAAKLLSAVLSQPQVKRLLSTDHFSVDGTLV
jgi:hypothetical protein